MTSRRGEKRVSVGFLPSGVEKAVTSALGQKQTSRHVRVMSVILLKADIHKRGLHVCFVPSADFRNLGWPNSSGLRRSSRLKVADKPFERLIEIDGADPKNASGTPISLGAESSPRRPLEGEKDGTS